MMQRIACCLGVVLALLPAFAQTARADLAQECEGYRYEPLQGSKPLLLMFSDGTRTDWLADRADYAATWGFDGFIIGGIMSNQTSDVWAADGDPKTMGEADSAFQTARRANAACRKAGIAHNFLLVAFSGALPDWWDDLAWSKIDSNFGQAARFARAAGFAGICIDSEYVGEQYHYRWPGYTYDHYTTADLRQIARRRMSEMAAAMYDEWPEMELFLVHSDDAPLAFEMFAGWVEEAARRGAPGGVQLATEGSYGACNVAYILAQTIDRARLSEQALSPAARPYWRSHGGMSPGGWPLWVYSDADGVAHKEARLNVGQFRAMMTGLNMASARYAWIYPNGPSWWQASPDEVERYHLSASAALPLAPRMDDYYRIARTPQQVADPAMVRASRALRTMALDNVDALTASLGLRPIWMMFHPDNQISRSLVPLDDHQLDWTARQVKRILDEEAAGGRPEVGAVLGMAREFSVIGPFDNDRWSGQERVFPPEQGIDLGATYQGVAGPVKWRQVTIPEAQGYLDFADLFKPKDWTVAYALCYVRSPVEQAAQIRAGTNDAIKLWFNGKLAYQYQTENGRWAAVDDDVIPVTLPAGQSTILVKVAQTTGRWGMYLRVSDPQGKPLDNITITSKP